MPDVAVIDLRPADGIGIEVCPVPEPVVAAPRPAARLFMRLGSSCGPVVFVDESAEYWSSVDGRSQVDYSVWLVVGCLLLAALVRAMLVVVRLPRGQNAT